MPTTASCRAHFSDQAALVIRPAETAQPPAIEPPRNELHLHSRGMSAAEAAEAIRQAGRTDLA